jgi:hypothetical protein
MQYVNEVLGKYSTYIDRKLLTLVLQVDFASESSRNAAADIVHATLDELLQREPRK